MATVYLETSFVSYLTSPERENRDPIAEAHRQITIDWWSRRRGDFDLVVSQIVVDEASIGHQAAAAGRYQVLQALPRLIISEQATELARTILAKGVLPIKAFPDALHIALATVHRIDYLLTWNCKHIANVEILPRIEALCHELGLALPIICTPEELLGGTNDH